MADIKRIFIFILLPLVITGCRTRQSEGTPTPFGTWAPVGDYRPVAIELADVIESPDSYEGAYIRLSGQYERLPLLVCGSDAHPSPATWQLRSSEGIIFASGRESELRRLIPDGLLMTVTGRMTHFEGAVGCGKRARIEQLWYLDVDQVISPNPIVRVTLTPDGMPISDIDVPNEGGIDVPNEGGSETISFPTRTPSPALAFPTATPIPTNTPFIETTPTSVPSFAVTTTLEPTSPSISTTPTRNGNSTPTASSPFDMVAIDKGDLIPENILNDELSNNEQHKWSLNTFTDEQLTAYAVGGSLMDMVITVIDLATGDVIIEQDDMGAGIAESLTLDITSGQYDVILSTIGGNSGPYSALYLLSNSNIRMTMLGLIEYGSIESGTLETDSNHYWVFEGEQGDTVNINVVPTASSDLLIELVEHVANADENSAGGAEEIDYTLPADGLYLISVSEINFETAAYTIIVTKTN